MKYQLISLLIISALLSSVSAGFSLTPVLTFMESFIETLNYDNVNPAFDNCSFYVNETASSVQSLLSRELFDHPEELIYAFGDNFAAASKYCAKVAMSIPIMLEYFRSELKNITLTDISNNVLENSYSINKDTFYFRYSMYRGIYDDSGEIFAQLFKMIVFGDVEIPVRRQLFELDEFADRVGVSSTLEKHIYAVLQGSQGFIDQTMVPDYSKFLQDLGALLAVIPSLEGAIKAENFNATIHATTNLYYKVTNLTADSQVFNAELVAFLKRETSIFDNEDSIKEGVKSLAKDIPATLANLQKLADSYEINNPQEIGKSIRAIFNQIKKGAMDY